MKAPYVIQLSWVPRSMLRQIRAPPFLTADDDSLFCSVPEIHCKLEGHSNWAWRALTPISWAHYRAAQEVSSRQWSWAYSNIRASVLSASLLAQMLLSLLWDSVFIQDQKNHTNYSKINKYHLTDDRTLLPPYSLAFLCFPTQEKHGENKESCLLRVLQGRD